MPVIVLTADATERQCARLLAAGATAYLTKPIGVRQLLEIIDSHLATPPITRAPAGATLTQRS